MSKVDGGGNLEFMNERIVLKTVGSNNFTPI